MCRWIAYTGDPVFIEQIVTLPNHSLVEQSRNTKMNFSPDGQLMNLNADGFGIGWYGLRKSPGLFKDDKPAWSDKNLKHLCKQTNAKTFFAHVRAATTGAVQRNNCHPFKHNEWLFQHNGHVAEFEFLRQDLQGEIAPDLFPHLQGTTDSETCFYLALTYGLQDNVKDSLRKMIRRLQITARDRKTSGGINMSIAISNGDTIYALRYAEHDIPKTQFYSEDLSWLAEEDHPYGEKPERGVVLVSEPLNQLDFHWQAIPENAFTIIDKDGVHIEDFEVGDVTF